MKLHGFHETVNVTLGVPIIRTSVDHGTGFDIAYRGNRFHTKFRVRIQPRRQIGFVEAAVGAIS